MQPFFPDARVTPLPPGFRFFRRCSTLRSLIGALVGAQSTVFVSISPKSGLLEDKRSGLLIVVLSPPIPSRLSLQVLVSHDFRLLQQTAREIWIVDRGRVTIWPSDIAAYKKSLIDNFKEFDPTVA